MSGWVPPETFEDLHLVRRIGKGGMGEVWLGHDYGLDLLVAVKFIADAEPDEVRRQRFLTEARAAARLTHSNVVRVYKIGEIDGRPYLVSEFVAGTALSALARPVSRELLLRVAAGLARGLAEAHAQGILHRDIKPSNVVLGDPPKRDVKLLDFGLAKFVDVGKHTVSLAPSSMSEPTRPGTILGTPLYMAPECLRGEPATASSDVYSLGAVLHDLCSASAPSRHRVATRLPGLDRRLCALIDRCLQEVPEDRFSSAVALLAELEPLLPLPRSDADANPYRGLRPFEEDHRSVFFGRKEEARAVVERLRTDRFVLIAGDSGVGKSSLCRAGILPLLRDRELRVGDDVRVAIVVPGRRPIRALAEAIVALRGEGADDVEREEAWLKLEPAALARAFHATPRSTVTTVLFVDQLEELLTLHDRERPQDRKEPEAFAAALAALVRSSAPARVLGAVRGDFFTRLAVLPDLGELVPSALFLLRPMRPEQLRETVVGPAQATGVAFESSETIDQLVGEAATGEAGLPLLQFTLAELWSARDVEACQIRRGAVEKVGGVGGALARHADSVLTSLVPEQRAAAQRLLLRLVGPQGTRVRRTMAELGSSSGPAREAMEALVRGRLVVAREVEGETAYDLAHEALLARWETLRDWIDSAGDLRQRRLRVEAAAAEWERLGGSREALWHRRQLREVARLDEIDLGEREQRFLAASRRAVRRARNLRAAAALAAPLLAGLFVASVRFQAGRQLDLLVNRHVESAEAALASARAKDHQSVERRAKAFALWDSGSTLVAQSVESWSAAETAWAEALELDSLGDAAYVQAALSLESALLLDPGRDDVRRRFAETTFARAVVAERNGHKSQRAELLARLRQYDAEGAFRTKLEGDAGLRLSLDPPATKVTVHRYVDEAGRRKLVAVSYPTGESVLEPGSYLLTFEAEGRVPVRYPLLLRPGEKRDVKLTLPMSAAVPDGFVFVPQGRFLFGSAEDEQVRTAKDGEPAQHEIDLHGYLIGRDEVTFAEFIEFLDALPDRQRALRTPDFKSRQGAVRLFRERGEWHLQLQPTNVVYGARFGEPIRYPGRHLRIVQDWRKLPISGISPEDAEAYTGWLDRTGRLPGARLCDEHEWERAARGADDRTFTVGDQLSPEDANFDLTYGRDPLSFGPDEVGSYPQSDSPFGVRDMVGNAQEIVRSLRSSEMAVERGGSWYQDRWSASLVNRTPLDRTSRSVYLGLRVCAPASADKHPSR